MKRFLITLIVFFANSAVFAADLPSKAMTCKGTANGKDIVLRVPSTTLFFYHLPETEGLPAELAVGDTNYGDVGLTGPRYTKSTVYVPERAEKAHYDAMDLADFYLCSWKKCAVRRLRFHVETLDNKVGAGYLNFRVKENGSRVDYSAYISCDITQ